MSRKYLALASRIKTELSDIEAVVKRITGGWERLQAWRRLLSGQCGA